jgi:hypothetical protein
MEQARPPEGCPSNLESIGRHNTKTQEWYASQESIAPARVQNQFIGGDGGCKSSWEAKRCDGESGG